MRAAHAVARALDGVDADRERGVRRSRREPEQPPQRHAEPLADPVVKRAVERGLATGQAVDVLEPLLDVLERERVVADERRSGGAQEVDDGVDGLAAVVDGRRLAAPDDALVLELDLNDRLIRARAARDAERLGERQRALVATRSSTGGSMTPTGTEAVLNARRARGAGRRGRTSAARRRAVAGSGSVTTVSLARLSISGRATPASTGVTRPIQWEERRGVRRGTGTFGRRRLPSTSAIRSSSSA